MIKTSDFKMSGRRRYAVDLAGLQVENSPRTWRSSVHCVIPAVWFRRKGGVTAACVGYLWDYQTSPPANAAEFLTRHRDGRYGGVCEGRWDGSRYWGTQEPEKIKSHLDLLRSMLSFCPDVPEGYDGWWVFDE